MKSYTTEQFRRLYRVLPDQVKKQAREAYQRFVLNPAHPSLHFKKVNSHSRIYSARINKDYRAVGVLDGDEMVWFWIGSHADYDKLLSTI